MYTRTDFPSKKAVKEALAAALAAGEPGLPCFQPGPFGPAVSDGTHCLEGPHYPKPHRFYATVTVKDGYVIKLK